jgi:hypothetical protein
MSTDRDTTRVVRSWMDEGVTALPERVLDSVLDQLPATPQRRPTWWVLRFPTMNNTLKYGLAVAAAVVVISLVGFSLFRGGTDNGQGVSASPTPMIREPLAAGAPEPNPPCSQPLAADGVPDGPLRPGTYVCYGVGQGNMNVQFTVPVGWEWHGSYLIKGQPGSPEEARISFFPGQVQVYTDPCLWVGSEPDPPMGSAVLDVVAALEAQPYRRATSPIPRNADLPSSELIVDRWEGMAIELTVPEDLDFAHCDGGQFRSWGPDPRVRAHQGPGQRDLVWVVDTQGNGVGVSGEHLIIDASWMPATPESVVSEVEAILESIGTGHWG